MNPLSRVFSPLVLAGSVLFSDHKPVIAEVNVSTVSPESFTHPPLIVGDDGFLLVPKKENGGYARFQGRYDYAPIPARLLNEYFPDFASGNGLANVTVNANYGIALPHQLKGKITLVQLDKSPAIIETHSMKAFPLKSGGSYLKVGDSFVYGYRRNGRDQDSVIEGLRVSDVISPKPIQPIPLSPEELPQPVQKAEKPLPQAEPQKPIPVQKAEKPLPQAEPPKQIPVQKAEKPLPQAEPPKPIPEPKAESPKPIPVPQAEKSLPQTEPPKPIPEPKAEKPIISDALRAILPPPPLRAPIVQNPSSPPLVFQNTSGEYFFPIKHGSNYYLLNGVYFRFKLSADQVTPEVLNYFKDNIPPDSPLYRPVPVMPEKQPIPERKPIHPVDLEKIAKKPLPRIKQPAPEIHQPPIQAPPKHSFIPSGKPGPRVIKVSGLAKEVSKHLPKSIPLTDIDAHKYSGPLYSHTSVLPLTGSGTVQYPESTSVFVSNDNRESSVRPGYDIIKVDLDDYLDELLKTNNLRWSKYGDPYITEIAHQILHGQGVISIEHCMTIATDELVHDMNDPHTPQFRLSPQSTINEPDKDFEVFVLTGTPDNELVSQKCFYDPTFRTFSCNEERRIIQNKLLDKSFQFDAALLKESVKRAYGDRCKGFTICKDPGKNKFESDFTASVNRAKNHGRKVYFFYIGHGEATRGNQPGVLNSTLQGALSYDMVLANFGGSARVNETYLKKMFRQADGVEVVYCNFSCFSGAALTAIDKPVDAKYLIASGNCISPNVAVKYYDKNGFLLSPNMSLGL